MKHVCVLGNGQLGRMLRQAGEPLGINVHLIGINDKLETIPYQHSIITSEIEHWSKIKFTYKLISKPNFINRDIFPQLVDRLLQKQLLDSLFLDVTPWYYLINKDQWLQLFIKFGNLIIIKYRTGGYNGYKQLYITPDKLSILPNEIYGNAIVEKVIPFTDEVSLIGARNIYNQCVFYPLTYNLHQNGILRASIIFPKLNKKLQTQAESMLSTIMTTLNYIGVMVMECFIINNKILINELAPRVHNSGHWTQNGASISQFELHLRSILNLPIFTPYIEMTSIMINLIGISLNIEWLSLPLIHLHWYEKDIYPNRKVGHLNLCSNNYIMLNESLNIIQTLLPNEYKNTISWINDKLNYNIINKKQNKYN
ncbi:MAG: 5-(carboxyamino)imidazole ribonucleotide synthase [Arsenophonus endosymbiont of Ceratovacuna japonica]